MTGVLDKLRAIGEETAGELRYELVQVQMIKEGGQWYLRFSLDRPGGITIDDCERFSRGIEPLLDARDLVPHRYILEVSSAGLDRPLLKQADYARFTGRQVAVRLYEPVNASRRFSGKLLGLTGGADDIRVELETGDGHRIAVPLDNIAQARLVPDL